MASSNALLWTTTNQCFKSIDYPVLTLFISFSTGDEEDNEVLYFPSLKYLHLHENDLRSVPPHIGYQKNLETLDISDNPKLEVLPKELGNLKVVVPLLYTL